MYTKKTVRDIEVAGQRVLVRVDFNVPIEDGVVTDDTRIRAALPTIRYLADHHARVILCSHLGRPADAPDPAYSLEPVCRVLSRLLGREVNFAASQDLDGEVLEATKNMADGEVMLLENLRFYPGEKTKDPEFARKLAALADIYVNDAFGTAHRDHASTVGVAELLPAVSGFLLSREVEMLTDMLADPEKPFVGVLGGSKVSDKIAVISKLVETCDTLLVGGGMAFTFIAAKGTNTGDSLVEPEWIDQARLMLEKAQEYNCEIMLPIDLVVAAEIAEDATTFIVGREEIPDGLMGLDIGPATSAKFQHEIERARTIYWNGPMGVFELEPFESGTRELAKAVARNNRAVSIIGGGDSVAALKKFGYEDSVTFISTGGGASMKLVEGAKLPGLEALDNK
ncbi:MAG: phosphoglycerate kinase [Coriobacteriia bacterium]|nr:phosphoglycerate kinase [Coriobacteriia bacterium]MCL2537268.1 phosphoglycerate kinase [Coriobacteriia bacterium]